MKLSRRELGQLAAVGLIGASAPGAFAAPKRRGSDVVFGLQSYSLRDRPLDEAIEAMNGLGVKVCELWQGHVEPKDLGKDRPALAKWRVETPLDHWKQIGAKFKKAGIAVMAYNYSFKDNFSDEEIARGFEHARALGAKAITASAHQNVVARVAPLAKKHRMKVAVHNHSHIKPNEFATAEDFEKAITGPGREMMAINLDIGHFTAANLDPVAFLKKHHARIVALHIKDRKKDQGPNMPFGQGDTPIKEVLATLRDKRWKIPANIEFEYPGDPVVEIGKCLDYCRQIVSA